MNMQFETLLSNLLKARFPLLYISTWEEDRAIAAINRITADTATIKTARKVFTWSVTTGMLGDSQSPKEETKDPLKALEMIEHCVVINQH